MTEKNLIKLGFIKTKVSAEESGGAAFHYYTWEPFDKSHFCLISCSNDETVDDKWYVEIYNDFDIRFFDKKDVKKLIKVISNNIRK